MKLVNIIVFFIICIVIQEYALSQESSLVANFLEKEWELYYKTDSIPKKVKQYYRKIVKSDFLISNLGENYNKTGLVVPGAPDKRIIFGGTLSNIGFVFYEEGGFAINYRCLIFGIKKRKVIKMEILVFNGFVTDYDEMRNAILKKDYRKIDLNR